MELQEVIYKQHTIKPGTPEHGPPAEQRTPRNSGGTTEHYPEHQRNTPEYQPNTKVTPVEYPGRTEPYKTNNNCSIFKRKFKPQKLQSK